MLPSGGERHFFTDEEFYQWIAPFDRRILQTARKGVYTFLHICKENLNMQRYKDYGGLVDVVNWGVYETDFPWRPAASSSLRLRLWEGWPTGAEFWWRAVWKR